MVAPTYVIRETHIAHIVIRMCRVRRDDGGMRIFFVDGEVVDGLLVDVLSCVLLTRLLFKSRVVSVDDNRSGSRSKFEADMIIL